MKACTIAIGIMLLLPSANAADRLADRLTMEKAVAIALEHNYALRSAQQNLDAAQWGSLSAVANYLPKVELSSSVTRIDPESELRANAAIDFIKASAGALGIPPSALTDIRPFAYRDTYASGVTVLQPIYNGGLEIVGIRAASATKDRSEFMLQDTEQDVIARVRMSYLIVLKAGELLGVSRESTERTRRYLETTRRRAEVGMRTQTDVLRWEVQLAAGEGTVITAQNYLALARYQLNETMGVDLNTPFELDTVSDSTGLTAVPVADTVSGSFLEAHPTMKAMEASLRLADINVARAWTNFQPRVNLAFQYGWERNNTLALDGIRPWALALSVSFPLFNGFGDYTGMEKAKAEYKSAESQVESFRRGLLLQAANAELSLRAARKRIEIAGKALQQALDVLNSVTRRYDTGGASNVDLLDAQTAYTAAKTEYVTAVYDFQIADIQRARATGVVSR
jgi:outer membrane protein